MPPPSDPARLALMPNLFIIGAAKAGSSALHAYLKPHPDILMGTEKEPCFFVSPDELATSWPVMARNPCSHDWDAYLDLFGGGEGLRYRGEGSTLYSKAPHCGGVPTRIKAICPEARIIYTVREPVRRAIVHYWQEFKEFHETLPLEQAVRENAVYRDSSDYALQLEAYLEHFDRSQIHIVVAEELRSRRQEVLAEAFDWLDLPFYEHSEAELTDRHRSPLASRKERFPMVRAIRDSALWASARKRLPKGVVDRLRKSATVEFDKAEMDETAARAWLTAYLEPRRKRFEEMIGRRIEAWEAG
jgi:hypothetical protein